MKRRILSFVLALTMALSLFSATALADGTGEYEGVKTYAVDWATGDRFGDGETVQLDVDGELFLRFELDPDVPGLLLGWRYDVLADQGFDITEQEAYPDDDGVAYAHIKAGSKQPGDVGVLPYNAYKVSDIFGPEAVGWKDAEPLFGGTVKIEVVGGDEPANILGDADTDGEVTILDATAVQRKLASLDTAAGIGEEVSYGTYFACWNIMQELLPEGCELTGADAEYARQEIRTAINLLVDRSWIVTEGIPVDRLPASTFVSRWVTDADGSEFYGNANGSGYGYFRADDFEGNVNAAIETLKKYYEYDQASGKFTNVPALSYGFNDSPVHANIANKIKNDFAAVGIELETVALDWNTYTETVAAGELTLARSGWVIDENDPMGFLEMWCSDSEDNMAGFGMGGYQDAAYYSLDLTDCCIDLVVKDGTWAQTYDALIELIRACEDREIAYRLMHKAEDMLMATGCIMPIYYY